MRKGGRREGGRERQCARKGEREGRREEWSKSSLHLSVGNLTARKSLNPNPRPIPAVRPSASCADACDSGGGSGDSSVGRRVRVQDCELWGGKGRRIGGRTCMMRICSSWRIWSETKQSSRGSRPCSLSRGGLFRLARSPLELNVALVPPIPSAKAVSSDPSYSIIFNASCRCIASNLAAFCSNSSTCWTVSILL